MIDSGAFVDELQALADRFNRTISETMVARYHAFLSDHMTTSQYRAAARVIYAHDTFWPAPARFLEAAGIDPKSDAERAWEQTLAEIKNGTAQPLSEYDPAHAAALRAVGKNARIAAVPTAEKLDFVKRDFVRAFTQHRERGGLPELEKPEPVVLPGLDVRAFG